MRLESARELKLGLTSRVVEPVARSAALGRTTLAVSAQPVAAVDTTFRTLAIGIAPRTRTEFRIAVRVQRRALLEGPHIERIRKAARGEVDVRYVGRIVKRAAPWYQRRRRPVRIGLSVGHYDITAGTLGCFVRRRSDGAIAILSNNHVLADENKGKPGDAILQPGKYDGGTKSKSTIGELAEFVRLSTSRANLVDCAIGVLRPTIRHLATRITGLGTLAGLGPMPETNARVAKLGRTTGLTHGRVTAFELDNVVVGYDLGNLRFDGQIEIEGAGADPFSDGGDSGSLIVDDELRGVALLFAGGDQGGTNGRGLTYANPLPEVLSRLRVDLLL
jgi:hypothetical protein